MEPEINNHTKQDKGLSALIWTLSILLCATIVGFMVVGIGFFRIMRVQTAVKTTPAPELPAV